MLLLLVLAITSPVKAKVWSFDACLTYALEHNIQIKKAELSSDRNQIQVDKAEAAMFPSVSATVRQNFSLDKNPDAQTGEYGSFEGSNSSTYSLNSAVTLFNGFKLRNSVSQAKIDLESGQLAVEVQKESVELSILSAFLQVIYASEQVNNAEKQIEATTEQLKLAGERFALNAISRSDLLQIESELASEKLTLASAESQFTMSKVNLMQLMELPVEDDFELAFPDIENLLQQQVSTSAEEIFTSALKTRPEIGKASMTTESARLDSKLAKSDLYPSVSVEAAVGTGYSSLNSTYGYASQLNNSLSPSIGLSVSIPIYQKKQVKSAIGLAQIGIIEAEVDELNTRNTLRKSIEQACADARSARSEYEAGLGKFTAVTESYNVATEKYRLGALNSVDFLYEKTNLIAAESQLLQSKFNLVFSNKVIDFYQGISLAF